MSHVLISLSLTPPSSDTAAIAPAGTYVQGRDKQQGLREGIRKEGRKEARKDRRTDGWTERVREKE